jgi:beta-glucosidase
MRVFAQSSRTLTVCALSLALVACQATTTRTPSSRTAPGTVIDPRARERTAAAAARARETEQRMTDDERFALVFSVFGANPVTGTRRDTRIPPSVPNSAGYTPGVPRLGVPALRSTDASMGVTNPGYRPDDKGATAMPASILVGASFNPQLAREGGAMIGREARLRGMNVLLGGGINLVRDVRNGRNYEYYSEDPLVSAALGAAAVEGTQGEGVISTLKHFALNDNETNRHWQNAVIDPAALRESDLLAFQIAIERSQPGSIMCGYNKVNGVYACGNGFLLNDVLKDAWQYKGYVMSDWGATPRWQFALAGLDQESGVQADVKLWGAESFTDSLRAAYRAGKLPKERLSDMVQRVLRSMYAVGVDAWSSPPHVNPQTNNELALETARQGIVLLKNENGALPLSTDKRLKVAVIGGYAQLGVPTGTGSGAVLPVGGYAAVVPIGGPGTVGAARNLYLQPSSPLAELKKLMPDAQFEFDPGQTPGEAALLAKRSDVVIAFGIRVEGEGFDLPDLSLPWGQDAVIDSVATVNPNTIVVLETGNPASMPWRNKVKAIVEAWYSGQAGGRAIAEVLTGKVNPSGRLPMTFPASLSQTPRPELPGLGTPWGTPVTIRYEEGADVGYRWYAKKNETPLYTFGHGLSYTKFSYTGLALTADTTVTATFTVTNTGGRDGADVPQLYLTNAAGDKRMRLLGFQRVELKPGESRRVTIVADPRLLARFDGADGLGEWRIAPGSYTIALSRAVDLPMESRSVDLRERRFGR